MDIVDPRIDDYLARTLIPTNAVVREMGEYGISIGFPIIGPQVGKLVYILARSIGARRVLELGSGFGYSAAWFAQAVGAGGRVVLTDNSQENLDRARQYLTRAGLADRTVLKRGDALALAEQEAGPFDIVFCDIDKESYPAALPIARRQLRVGGYFICDNMLRAGRVIADQDEGTRGIRKLTAELVRATDFETTIVPVRDGVSLSLRTA